MRNIITVLLLAFSTLCASCNELREGYGYVGVPLDGMAFIVLEGDTFSIDVPMSDSLLIISAADTDEEGPQYLLRLEGNGFYFVKKKASAISPMEDTERFFITDRKDVYDMDRHEKVFTPKCGDIEALRYIGPWKDGQIFECNDTVLFSDGNIVALQDGIRCDQADNGGLRLSVGVESVVMSPDELVSVPTRPAAKNPSIYRLEREYAIVPESEREDIEASYRLQLDIPRGDNETDSVVRDFIYDAVAGDLFSLISDSLGVPRADYSTCAKMVKAIDGWGPLWAKVCRLFCQDGDGAYARLRGDIRVVKIADCEDYATYYYYSSLYEGGLHDMYQSYYFTYDKHRQSFLVAENSIRPEKMKELRRSVLKSMVGQFYDEWNDSCWNEYTTAVFAFSTITNPNGAFDDLMETMTGCDSWSGWKYKSSGPYTFDDFPLPHFAILPEGIAFTYHPYQIDSFSGGEHYAFVPFPEAAEYLVYDYPKRKDMWKVGVSRFVRPRSR